MSLNDASRIVIDNSIVMLQMVAPLIDHSRGIMYNSNMFIIPATDLLAKKCLYIASNQFTIVISFHQIFMASTHSDFFQGRADRGLIYWPNHSGETWLTNQEEEEENCRQAWLTWIFSNHSLRWSKRIIFQCQKHK